MGLIAAFITAFYTFRMIFLTFFGKPRMDEETEKHVHESPWSMIVPLIVLAVASLLGGFLGLPGKLGVIQSFLEPVFAPANHILGIEEHGLTAHRLRADGGLAARGHAGHRPGLVHVRAPDRPAGAAGGQAAAGLQGGLQQVLRGRVLRRHRRARWRWTARAGSGTSSTRRSSTAPCTARPGCGSGPGTAVRPLQTGRVQNYLLGMFIGLFVIVTVVVFL